MGVGLRRLAIARYALVIEGQWCVLLLVRNLSSLSTIIYTLVNAFSTLVFIIQRGDLHLLFLTL